MLYEQFGLPDYGDILDEQYPDKEYDPDRTKEILPPPVPKLKPNPGGEPQLQDEETEPKVAAAERLAAAIVNLNGR